MMPSPLAQELFSLDNISQVCMSNVYAEREYQQQITPALCAYTKILAPTADWSRKVALSIPTAYPFRFGVLTRKYTIPNPDPEGFGEIKQEQYISFWTPGAGEEFKKFHMSSKQNPAFQEAFDKLKGQLSKNSKERDRLMTVLRTELNKYASRAGLNRK